MRRMASEFLIGLLIFGLMFSGFIGCGDDEGNGDGEEAPELPPDTSMSIDLSLFGGGTLRFREGTSQPLPPGFYS